MERLHPGVFIEEVAGGARPIEGVSTSTTAFLGKAERGPLGRALIVTSFTEFKTRFGGFLDDSFLALRCPAVLQQRRPPPLRGAGGEQSRHGQRLDRAIARAPAPPRSSCAPVAPAPGPTTSRSPSAAARWTPATSSGSR